MIEIETLPGVYQEQIRGAVCWYRRIVAEYTDDVKNKQVAHVCETWGDTVTRLVSLAKTLGELEKLASVYEIDLG
jgi:hypothetical protein